MLKKSSGASESGANFRRPHSSILQKRTTKLVLRLPPNYSPLYVKMARVAQVNMPRPAASTGELGELHSYLQSLDLRPSMADSPQDDECPVCHSKRYLRKDMQFKISPVCYHRMCTNCVERIFQSGKAPCPIAGCHKTLNKGDFRTPKFQDLAIEREMDIRRKVAKVFNRREDDFESLRDYNDYLNDVEDITFNLIHNIDVEATNARLEKYKAENYQAILENQELEREELQDEKARQVAEQEFARRRREAALREDEEGRRELREARNGVIEQLASGEGNARRIARESQKAMLRRSKDRMGMFERSQTPVSVNGDTFTIKGLKKRQKVEPEKPYDPFGGIKFDHEYYTLQDDYEWDDLKKAKTETRYLAGGYNIHDFYSRALCDAFSGLGVFVSEELSDTNMAAGPAVGTAATVDAGASTKMDLDDPLG